MTTIQARAEQRIAKIFSPIMTATALGVLLAGCSHTSTSVPDSDDMVSSTSSSAAMMEASSSEAMMSSSVEGMMSSPSAKNMYRDGTFGAEGVYASPAGGESVHVSLTIKDNTVTDATFSGDATHPKSMKMQEAFGAGFMEQVVGKSLDEVSVGVVNGSSLTGIGFMDAVKKIKAEAKA